MSFLDDADITIKALEEYHRESISARKRVIHQEPLETIIAELRLDEYIRGGGLSGDRLSAFLERYLSTTTRLHHPAYMAHQVAAPHYAGALGSLIDGFTNNAMAIYEMGPGASSIEYHIIDWLLEKVGWPNTRPISPTDARTLGGGILTHGGSLANLTALIAARSRIVPDVWQTGSPGDLALLAPDGCHYSIVRSAGVLGMGRKSIYSLRVDERGAVLPDALPEAYERLRNDGKRAVALVANACSTAVGIYDPLEEIGDFCRANGVWLHVDGAHGASALLSTTHRALMNGIERADSLTWDAHKLLMTPTLCAALLVRDHRHLDAAFEHEASYLFHEKVQPGFDFIHRTFECTKAGLGLKLFLVLAAVGERALAEFIESQFDLTARAYDYICRQKDFECPVKPESNILCFRIAGMSDEEHIRIRDRLISGGRFYISTASFMGKRYLRLVLMSPATALDTIDLLIREIRALRDGAVENES